MHFFEHRRVVIEPNCNPPQMNFGYHTSLLTRLWIRYLEREDFDRPNCLAFPHMFRLQNDEEH